MKPDTEDVLGVLGVATLTAGAALIYLPAGLIVLGLLALALSYWLARG